MPRNDPTVLTAKDIEAICYQACPETLSHSGTISNLRSAYSHKLDSSTLRCSFDGGRTIEYRVFPAGQRLSWRDGDGNWCEETCECLESSAANVFLVHYLRTDTQPFGAATLVLDWNTSLVTIVESRLGTVHSNRDVQRTLSHGVLGDTKTTARHTKTDELVGAILDWRFAPDVALHAMYETVQCCAFVSPPPAAAPDWHGFFRTFNPTRYRKIADRLYLVSFTAPGSSGMEANMLMDLDAMRAVGSVFGIDSSDTLRSYTFGAAGAHADIGFIGRYCV